MEREHTTHTQLIKLSAPFLRELLTSYMTLRESQGDWKKETAYHYRFSLKLFADWYEEHFEEFDSTRSLVREWTIKAKSFKDNTNNYRVVGNFARYMSDCIQVLQSKGFYIPT